MQDEAFRGQKREGCGLRKGSLAVAHPRGDLLQRYKYLLSTSSNSFPPSNMSFFYRHGRCPLLKVGIPNHPLLRLAKPKSTLTWHIGSSADMLSSYVTWRRPPLEMSSSVCSACPSSSAGLWCHILCIDFQVRGSECHWPRIWQSPSQ